MRLITFLSALMLAAFATPSLATTFHNFMGNTATGDSDWQTAATGLGGVLFEQDFESFLNGSKINSFAIGGITVSIWLSS